MKLQFNITAKLLGYLLVASVLPFAALGVVALQLSTQSLTALAREQNVHIVGGFAAYLRLHIDQVDQLVGSIAHNDAIGQALDKANNPRASSFDEFNARAQLSYAVSGYASAKGLVSLDLFSMTGVNFHIGETLNPRPISPQAVANLLAQATASSGPTFWRGMGPNVSPESRYPQVSTVVRAIQYYSPSTGQAKPVGVLVISLNDDVMRDYLARATILRGQKLMKLDRNGTVELHSDARMVGSRLSKEFLDTVKSQVGTQELRLDGDDVLMDVVHLDAGHGDLVMITPRQLVTGRVDQLTRTTVGLLVLGLLGIAALTWHYAVTVVRPIRAVSHGFKSLEHMPSQALTSLEVPKSGDEIAALVEGYNHYLQTLNGLEEQVAKRTASLEEALKDLQHAHNEVMQAEKLASLGRIVAAVAHELNTPIGNAVTVGSTIGDELQALRLEMQSNAPRRSLMTAVLNKCDHGVLILMRSLDRAASLIGNFKQVAADQTSDQRRSFDLAETTEEILSTVAAVVNKQSCQIVTDLEPGIACDGYPGAYGQVLINLVMNAAVHAYPDGGKVYVSVRAVSAEQVRLSVRDAGVGMPLDIQNKIFEPFFTTRLGQGGSGLGMSIVHGLATKTLGGSITVNSTPHVGTECVLLFARVAPRSLAPHLAP
ncbi:sensor histidine kinase [Rhodoferax aquaticus]|uniref:histidine kinase n=1 Tax=Rhodoferax aquaticus TaxID=2527691 RepID=A0A515EJE5_9BURK|nr:sensor histidine kinase [Rhodoferax aquaticus]QDL52797.1 sensor histidine kinase [Rhodoferax aquaticus]